MAEENEINNNSSTDLNKITLKDLGRSISKLNVPAFLVLCSVVAGIFTISLSISNLIYKGQISGKDVVISKKETLITEIKDSLVIVSKENKSLFEINGVLNDSLILKNERIEALNAEIIQHKDSLPAPKSVAEQTKNMTMSFIIDSEKPNNESTYTQYQTHPKV